MKIWKKLRYRSHMLFFIYLNNCSIFIHMSPYLHDPFSIMRGPRELLFYQLVVLLHRSKRHSNSFWAHRMYEISSHKVSSILSLSGAKIKTFFFKVHGRFSIIRWPRELIFGGFSSTVGYNVPLHYRLLDSLHVLEIFKKVATENRGKYGLNSTYNDPTNL